MVHFVCDCLNIRIHAKDSSLTNVEPEALNVTNEGLSHPFFQNGVCAVVLDLAGITKEVQSLVKTHMLGDWIVCVCLNCKLASYAVHSTQGLDHVLVSQRMKSDPSFINGTMQSEHYSPLFKIVLHHKQETPNRNALSLELHIRRSDVLEAALNALQQQLTRYLHLEQDTMEDRIRSFSEQQRLTFSALQSRVRLDKQTISSILQESEEHDLQDSLSEAMIDTTGLTPPMTPVSNTNQSCSPLMNSGEFRDQLNSEEQDQVRSEIPKPKPIRQRPQSFGRPLHGKLAARKKALMNPPRIAQSLDSDGIFDLEGLEDELTTPFYHSEDDDVELWSDKDNDDVFIPVNPKDAEKSCPMSLPIDMPMWAPNRQLNDDSDDENKELTPEDPAQIAASIKALAKSVRQSDGTAMFGDLPRPRLNTLN